MEKRGDGDGADAELRFDADFVLDPAQTCTGNGKDKKAFLIPQSKRPNLPSLQIPAWSVDIALSTFAKTDSSSVSRSPSSARGLPPRPSSAKARSSMRGLLPQRSFKTSILPQDTEKTGLIVPDTPPSDAPLDKPSTSGSLSLNNKVIFSPPTKVSHSLPVSPIATSGAENVRGRHLGCDSHLSTIELPQHMTRSLSVPVNGKTTNFRATNSRGLIRVISAKSHRETVDVTSTLGALVPEIAIEDASEDIPEEEAVCRICWMELGEEGNTLKLECSCKGDLALAHQECAVKWFTIKGNRTCDICKADVQNLPVTLLKVHNSQTAARQTSNTSQQSDRSYYRVWQDVPVLIVVSVLSYFCFLEQLLVSDLGPRALAISLPFSCVLGLLSSMIASTMVSRSYVWAYGCFQFAILILLAHIFYTILNVNAILSILLSSFVGFGIAISMNSLIMEYIHRRTSRQIHSSAENVNRAQHQHRDRVQGGGGQEDQGRQRQPQRQQQESH